MKNCRAKALLVAMTSLVAGGARAQAPVASSFYTLPPCRIVDTRGANGAVGGPALAAGGTRDFQVVGTCGVPVTARAVVLNVTVTGGSSSGLITIYPSGVTRPSASSINWGTGQTRANNVSARLGSNGALSVFSSHPSGIVHLIMDVSGYFVDPPGATPLSTFQTFANIGSFGATPGVVAHIRDIGINAWITEQTALPASTYVPTALWPNDIPSTCTGTCQRDNYTMYPLQKQFFLNALYGPDQLRQRVAFALHKFIVVSGTELVQPSRMVPYLNILVNNAFGNYRNILYQITLNGAMGEYLNMRTSTLLNPNENYAREILQLFSLGVFKLNADGTQQLDINNNPIPTYDQTTITEFARVFTGWALQAQPAPGIDNYTPPMLPVPANHDKGSKTLLNGKVLSPNQTPDKDLNDAIDNIFNHQNVGPYVAGMLIRDLVTSNPSPAYVGRVAAVFNDNGLGVRGDLAAVVRAILTDADAIAAASDPNFGSLRDPVVMTVSILRGLGALSADGSQLSDGVLAPQVSNLGQILFQPDTVFGYYPADYLVPGTSLLGPEFGSLSAITAFRRANLVNTLVYSTIAVGTNNPLGTSLDLTGIQTLAGDPNAMVEELNQRLCRGLLSASAKASIVTAVNAAGATPKVRAQVATYLVATSSQYQVER
ncbi:MAG: DUF1800 domain-containing protein [Thermoanaerobaculia bacterium]|jgi:hypothetical protein